MGRLRALLAREERLAAEARELAAALGAAIPRLPDVRARGAVLDLRRALHRDLAPVEDLDAVGPLWEAAVPEAAGRLPERLDAHLSGRRAARRARRALERALEAERRRATDALLAAASSRLFREALFLASRAADRALSAALRERARAGTGAGAAPPDLDPRLESTLLRYLARGAFTATPNGLWAGSALVRLEPGRARAGRSSPRPAPAAALAAPFSPRLAVEPDLTALDRALLAFSRRGPVAPHLRPRPNPTLAGAGDVLRFRTAADPTAEGDGAGREVVCELPASPLNRLALDLAAAGRLAARDLARALRRRFDPEVPLAEYRERVAALLACGALVPGLAVPPDAPSPLAAVRRRAARLPARAAAALSRTLDAADGLGTHRAGASLRPLVAAYERSLAALAGGRLAPAEPVVRGDAILPLARGRDRIPAAVEEAVREAVAAHAALFAAIEAGFEPLGALAQRFLARFGRGPVPLLDAEPLVAEVAGAWTRRVEGLPAGERSRFYNPLAAEGLAAYGRYRDLVLERAAASPHRVDLTAADLERVGAGRRPGTPPLPADVLFQVAAPAPADLEAGRVLVLVNSVHPQPGALTARFCRYFPALTGGPRRALSRRATRGRPTPVEVHYHPAPVRLNLGLRPRYARDAIPVAGPPLAAPRTRTHLLGDLRLGLEPARGGGRLRFVLRTRSGEALRPVHHSAIVTFPSIAWLLQELGLDPDRRLNIRPRFVEERPTGDGTRPRLAHVPRIVCGRAVLSRERWVLAPGELPAPPRRGDGADLGRALSALERVRSARGLPRHLFVRSDRAPRPIAVDLEAPLLAADLLRLAALARLEVVLEEALPGPQDLWLAEGPPDGGRTGARHACEILVTLDAPTG